MKKIVTMLITVSMVLNLCITSCFAVENDRGQLSSSTGSESMMVAGQLCFWNNVENSPVAIFKEDGSLSVAWVGQNNNGRVLLHTTVPAETLEQVPTLADNSVDLQYIVENTEALELLVSIEDQLDIREDTPALCVNSDTLKLNAVRACVNRLHSTSTYNMMQHTYYTYSPVLIDMFETKTVETNYIKTHGNILKAGWDAAKIVSKLVSLTGLPSAAIASYVNDALNLSSGVLFSDVTIEEYEVDIRYFRTAGYRANSSSSVVMCPSINEERALSYKVWVNYTEVTADTTDFSDITHVVGDPIETYLSSASSFSEESIVAHAYTYYQRNN